VHHDTHDVFVLQTHGRKAWRVYRPLVELAGPDQPWKESLGDPGEPILEAELAPGNALYIPRGFPHDAEAQDGVSVHITVGILASTWVDVWRSAMREVSEQRSFREPLPIGFADDPDSLATDVEVKRKELHAWIDEMVGPDAVARFAERFWRQRRPVSAGRIESLEQLDDIDAGTRVRRAPDGVFRVGVDDDRVTLLLGLREVTLPAFCEPALSFIAGSEIAFTPGDLPGLADEASAVVLVKRLVREGALELVER
jgi:hypothetical protein